jgi:GTP-binding protein HflX
VWNKIDLREGGAANEPGAERDEYGRISRVFVSARTGAGLARLRMAIGEAAQRRATAAPAAVAISI